MLQVPEVGGTGQSVAWVAIVQWSEQNVRLPPMKQRFEAQSEFIVQGEPNGRPPPSPASVAMSEGSGGWSPPQAGTPKSTRRDTRAKPQTDLIWVQQIRNTVRR
jgi:hypothetical protein